MIKNRHFGILGGGFGLYGYLPAILNSGYSEVSTLEKYRETIFGRPDLAPYRNAVVYRQNRRDLLNDCDVMIVAMRPSDQQELIDELLESGWEGKLVLEKPLCPNPEDARRRLDRLMNSKITFRMGFTLGMTMWASKVREFLVCRDGSPKNVDIRWCFHAHHYSFNVDTWKRFSMSGGGALRFYAIHIIALLSQISRWTVDRCERHLMPDGEEPACDFTVSCEKSAVSVTCQTDWLQPPEFAVRGFEGDRLALPVQLKDPFDEEMADSDTGCGDKILDKRVRYIQKTLEALMLDSTEVYEAYVRHVNLWQELETKAVASNVQ